jgi:hypothetical protein
MIKFRKAIVVHLGGRGVFKEPFGSFVTFHVVMFTDLGNPGTYTHSALSTYESQ